MAFIPVANVAEVNLRQRLFGQQIENTMYFRFDSGSPSVSDLNTLAAAVESWFVTQIMFYMSNNITYHETNVVDLTTATSPTGYSLAEQGSTGNVASPALPGNVCICASFRSTQRGRSARGRNYLAGLPESLVTGNVVDTALLANITSGYDIILTTPFAGWTWVIVSRYNAGVPRVAGTTFDVVSAGFVDDVIDSQRRRLTGRGG